MSSHPRIAVAINAKAGKHNAESSLLANSVEPLLRDVFAGHGEIVVYKTASFDELDRAVVDAARSFKAEVFMMAGGDGTVHQVCSRVIPTYRYLDSALPIIGIIPTGTMNVIAKGLGLTANNRHKAFEGLVKRLRNGDRKIVRAHAMSINDRYGFIYGSGLPVNALAMYNAYEKRGMLRAAHVAGRIACREALVTTKLKPKQASIALPYTATVSAADAEVGYIFGSEKWTAMMAGSIESIGIGSKPIYRARERPGHFHLLAAEHGFWGFVNHLPSVITGGDIGGAINHPLRCAKIVYAEPTTRFIDGDMYGNEEFGSTDELTCGPLLTFLAP